MEILRHLLYADKAKMPERLEADSKRGQRHFIGPGGNDAAQRNLVLAIMLRRKAIFGQQIVNLFADRRA